MKIGLLALAPVALAPVALASSLAFADDSMGRVTPTDHQRLRECVEHQMSNPSVTVSKAEAKRYCKDQLKRQKATGASPEPQPAAPPAPADSPAPPLPPPG
ncbi:MAG: hypothetical protein ABSC32_17505 [Steroidobacteraceae bacterium]|jgi:hypothetical protein